MRLEIDYIEATDMGNDQQKIAEWVLTQHEEHCIVYEAQEDFDEYGWIVKACKALGWSGVPSTGGLNVHWKQTGDEE